MSNIIEVKLWDFSSFVHSTFRNKNPISIFPSELAKNYGRVELPIFFIFIDIERLFEHILSMLGFRGLSIHNSR